MPQPHLSRQKIASFTELFCEFDHFSTGTINESALLQILKSLHIDLEIQQIHQLLKDSGNKSKSSIKLCEFLSIFSILVQDKELSKQIQTIFTIFDADNNGILNKKDIQQAITILGLAYNQEEVLKMLKSTRRKQINFDQFEDSILKNM